MCLTTKDPTIKIAEKDITVYKILDKKKVKRKGFFNRLFNGKYRITYEAINNNYEYTIGTLNPIVEIKPFGGDAFLDFAVEEGYRSYVHETGRGRQNANAIFVIPKGTKYIQGYCNNDTNIPNYVSETIIFVKEI